MPGAAPHPIVRALIEESASAARSARDEAARMGAGGWLAPAMIRFRWLDTPPAGAPEIVEARLFLGDAAGTDEGAGDAG